MIYPTIGCALLRHTDLYTDVNVIVSRAYPYPKPSFKNLTIILLTSNIEKCSILCAFSHLGPEDDMYIWIYL